LIGSRGGRERTEAEFLAILKRPRVSGRCEKRGRLELKAPPPADLGAMNWRSITPIRPNGLTACDSCWAMGASSGQ
jgi:hypothetical protein